MKTTRNDALSLRIFLSRKGFTSVMSAPQVLSSLRHRAASLPGKKFILLPEFVDPRVLSAARKAADLGLAKIGIPGNKDAIFRHADAMRLDLSCATIIDTGDLEILDFTSAKLVERRKGKESLSMADAKARVLANNIDFANLLISCDLADGVVSGSVAPTASVVRSAIQCVGLGKSNRTASSFFVMAKGDKWKILADCGFIMEPSSEQLACIANTTANSTRALLGVEPVVAMLSFSTRGSASHANVDKVRTAVEIAKKDYPGLIIDGEMQADAALVPEICESKAPGSPVNGAANVLVFPDLQAGNIAYKLLERLGGWTALGPLLQGFAKPTNDLSRGCTDEDIVNSVAITALQANRS